MTTKVVSLVTKRQVRDRAVILASNYIATAMREESLPLSSYHSKDIRKLARVLIRKKPSILREAETMLREERLQELMK